jgi:hypothetical protein
MRSAALQASYHWIFHHPRFKCWRNGSDSQGLGIRGDPGKGKSKLLCGIIDELHYETHRSPRQDTPVFSFYQATVPELSNTNAMLCRLIYMLVDPQLSFISHIQKSFKDTREPRFGDAETWTALCNMFLDILRDLRLVNFYM